MNLPLKGKISLRDLQRKFNNILGEEIRSSRSNFIGERDGERLGFSGSVWERRALIGGNNKVTELLWTDSWEIRKRIEGENGWGYNVGIGDRIVGVGEPFDDEIVNGYGLVEWERGLNSGGSVGENIEWAVGNSEGLTFYWDDEEWLIADFGVERMELNRKWIVASDSTRDKGKVWIWSIPEIKKEIRRWRRDGKEEGDLDLGFKYEINGVFPGFGREISLLADEVTIGDNNWEIRNYEINDDFVVLTQVIQGPRNSSWGSKHDMTHNWLIISEVEGRANMKSDCSDEMVERAGVIHIWEKKAGRWQYRETVWSPFPVKEGKWGWDVEVWRNQMVISERGACRVWVMSYDKEEDLWDFDKTYKEVAGEYYIEADDVDVVVDTFGRKIAVRGDGVVKMYHRGRYDVWREDGEIGFQESPNIGNSLDFKDEYRIIIGAEESGYYYRVDAIDYLYLNRVGRIWIDRLDVLKTIELFDPFRLGEGWGTSIWGEYFSVDDDKLVSVSNVQEEVFGGEDWVGKFASVWRLEQEDEDNVEIIRLKGENRIGEESGLHLGNWDEMRAEIWGEWILISQWNRGGSGVVGLFKEVDGVWSLIQRIEGLEDDIEFGRVISIYDDRFVVGSNDKLWVYRLQEEVWINEMATSRKDCGDLYYLALESKPININIYRDYIIVGLKNEDVVGFIKTELRWRYEFKIIDDSGQLDLNFGKWVNIENNRILIGAPNWDYSDENSRINNIGILYTYPPFLDKENEYNNLQDYLSGGELVPEGFKGIVGEIPSKDELSIMEFLRGTNKEEIKRIRYSLDNNRFTPEP